MRAEDLADAGLPSLDQGGRFRWPSVADFSLQEKVDSARTELFVATQGHRATLRYLRGMEGPQYFKDESVRGGIRNGRRRSNAYAHTGNGYFPLQLRGRMGSESADRAA